MQTTDMVVDILRAGNIILLSVCYQLVSVSLSIYPISILDTPFTCI